MKWAPCTHFTKAFGTQNPNLVKNMSWCAQLWHDCIIEFKVRAKALGKTPVRIILWCPTTKMLIKACFLIQPPEQEGMCQKLCISLCSKVLINRFYQMKASPDCLDILIHVYWSKYCFILPRVTAWCTPLRCCQRSPTYFNWPTTMRSAYTKPCPSCPRISATCAKWSLPRPCGSPPTLLNHCLSLYRGWRYVWRMTFTGLSFFYSVM